MLRLLMKILCAFHKGGDMKQCILSILVLLLCACVHTNKVAVVTPPPMTPIQQVPQAGNNVEDTASLYNEATGIDLYGNSRASRIGDIVMVQIVDSSKAKQSANTKLERTNELSLGIQTWAGQATGKSPLLGVSTDTKTEGKASTDRENSVTATIATRVVGVLPGGILQIEGMRATQINNEIQYLVVKGLVRMRDVDANNSVLSTKLAESTIGYYGKGDISDQQKQGWGTRFVNTIWPF